MYCTITKKKEPKLSHNGNVYRKIEWKQNSYNAWQGYWSNDDLIDREPKDKWVLTMNESYRENGKVKKKQTYLTTISYWHIIDEWADMYIGDAIDKILLSMGADNFDVANNAMSAEYIAMKDLIYLKFNPIVTMVKDDYASSEEYTFRTANEIIKAGFRL